MAWARVRLAVRGRPGSEPGDGHRRACEVVGVAGTDLEVVVGEGDVEEAVLGEGPVAAEGQWQPAAGFGVAG